MSEKNMEQMVNEIGNMTVFQLSELVKELETKFGVSAAMPVAAPVAATTEAAPKADEKSEYQVELVEGGPDKIKSIKALRSVTTLDLGKAKSLVENLGVIAEAAPKADAEKIKKALEEVGAKVKLS